MVLPAFLVLYHCHGDAPLAVCASLTDHLFARQRHASLSVMKDSFAFCYVFESKLPSADTTLA